VDDEPAIVDLVAALLVDEGYDVWCAHDGVAALEAAGRDRFDVIVADVMMPGLDGVGLLRSLRQRGYRVPVVLMSAAYAEVDWPGVRFVRKPFDLDHLAAIIDRALHEQSAD
jgi:two-component system response regulator MprA